MDSSAHADLEPELPKRIGRYDAFLEIGSGGMARVYLAVQHGPFKAHRLVVIKQVREEVANDPQFLEMFVDEARIAMRLNHPNVVHTYEVLDDAPDYYLIMEYLEGQSLLEVLRKIGRQRVPLHDHLWILTQLLAGLHYAHDLRDFDGTPLQIVHRDVTPSNVFICRTGSVKLLDFGIAKLAGAVAATRAGMLKGKLGYVAPEQCLGQQASVQSDIYAVGVMLWEAMARRRRNSGETQAAQIQARIQGAEPPIENVWPHAPPALVAIARRALSTQPEARYATAREFQHDIERYLAQKQSKSGAESVARLLRQHFEKERAATHRAIAARLENAGGVSAAQASAPAPVPPVQRDGEASTELANDNAVKTPSEDSDASTSLVSIDRQLLKATRRREGINTALSKLGQSLRQRGIRIARAVIFSLPRLRWHRHWTRLVLTFAAAFATAGVVAALAGTSVPMIPTGAIAKRVYPERGPTTSIFAPTPLSSPPPAFPPPADVSAGQAVATPTAAPNTPTIATPVAPPRTPEPPPPTAAPNPPAATEVQAAEPATTPRAETAALPPPPEPDEARDRQRASEVVRAKPRTRRADDDLYSLLAALDQTNAKRFGAQPTQPPRTRSRTEPTAPSTRPAPNYPEPGMDLRVAPSERTAGCIDEEEPY